MTPEEAMRVLRVGPDATKYDLHRAYLKRSFQTHPDRGGDPEKFRKVSEAYDLLLEYPKKETVVQDVVQPENGTKVPNRVQKFPSPTIRFFHRRRGWLLALVLYAYIGTMHSAWTGNPVPIQMLNFALHGVDWELTLIYLLAVRGVGSALDEW